MTVEDALEKLFTLASNQYNIYGSKPMDTWSYHFILNVYSFVVSNKTLSTEQGKIILKLLRKYQNALDGFDYISLTDSKSLLDTPRYRNLPYQSAVVPREVRYIGGNYLGFRCKVSESFKTDIAKLRNMFHIFKHDTPWFHADYRVWVIAVTSDSLPLIENLISDHKFQFDDAVVEFLAQCRDVVQQPSEFFFDEEMNMVACNIADNELLSWWVKHVVEGETI